MIFYQTELCSYCLPEADWKDSFTCNPPVRDNSDEVLRRERFKHWNKELDGVLVLTELLLQQEELVMQDVLTVHILNQDPECFRVTVNLLIPLKNINQSELFNQLINQSELRSHLNNQSDFSCHIISQSEMSRYLEVWSEGELHPEC